MYNIWKSNYIEVEPDNEYYIRIYGHNNNPGGYEAIAEDGRVKFIIPPESGRTIVVEGQIASSNAEPDRYWDDVVLSCKDRFRLEYIEGSAHLENNEIGAGSGVTLSDDVANSWVMVGYNALDGEIPGCYKYDFYITFKVKVVAV